MANNEFCFCLKTAQARKVPSGEYGLAVEFKTRSKCVVLKSWTSTVQTPRGKIPWPKWTSDQPPRGLFPSKEEALAKASDFRNFCEHMRDQSYVRKPKRKSDEAHKQDLSRNKRSNLRLRSTGDAADAALGIAKVQRKRVERARIATWVEWYGRCVKNINLHILHDECYKLIDYELEDGAAIAVGTKALLRVIKQAQAVRDLYEAFISSYNEGSPYSGMLTKEIAAAVAKTPDRNISVRTLLTWAAYYRAKCATGNLGYEEEELQSFFDSLSGEDKDAYLSISPKALPPASHLGRFPVDGRSSEQENDVLLQDECFTLPLLTWMKSQRNLTVATVTKHVNAILPGLSAREIEAYKLVLPVSKVTVKRWMEIMNCSYVLHHKSYNTDTHENAAGDRGRYNEDMHKVEMRSMMFVRLTAEEYVIWKGKQEFSSRWPSKNVVHDPGSTKKTLVQLPADADPSFMEREWFFDIDLERSAASKLKAGVTSSDLPCAYNHNPDVCKCGLKLITMGHDESTYQLNSMNSKVWTINGCMPMRPKGNGKSIMVSGFCSEFFGFGVPCNEGDLAKFNAHRKALGREDAKEWKEPPAVYFFNLGINDEGFWGSEHICWQTLALIDWFELFYPGYQLAVQYDHSSGHNCRKPDGLMSRKMNKSFGGAKPPMRSSNMTEHTVGEQPAVTWRLTAPDGIISYHAAKGAGEGEWKQFDRRVYAGNVQDFVFKDDDLPPCGSLNAPKYDTEVNLTDVQLRRNKDALAARLLKRSRFSSQKKQEKDDADDAKLKRTTKTIPGYVGKPKGALHIAFERGLAHNGKLGHAAKPEANTIRAVLDSCHDFKEERSKLEELFWSRGHILIMCVAGHPELAGYGIEYLWGVSKLHYRSFNDCKFKNMEANVRRSFEYINKIMCRKFAFKCRRYRLAYMQPWITSANLVEKFVAVHKTHRNILDQESSVLQKELREAKMKYDAKHKRASVDPSPNSLASEVQGPISAGSLLQDVKRSSTSEPSSISSHI